MKIANFVVAALVVLNAGVAIASSWPQVIDPYPQEATIDKPMAVTVDITDDMWRSRARPSAANIENLMKELAALGFKQVNWLICPERYLEKSVFEDVTPHDGVRLVADAAHRNGMTFYALFKPFETGSINAEVPPAVKVPADMPHITTLSGRLYDYAPFVAKHSQMRIERRPVDERLDTPVATIKLVKLDAKPTRVDRQHLELLIGKENGQFEPYTGPMTFACAVEERQGKDVRVITLSGLKIDPAYRYFVVHTTFDKEGPGDFTNSASRIIELYDKTLTILPSSSDRDAIDTATLRDTTLRYFWLVHTGRWGIPAEYALDSTYGSTPQTTAYWFGVTQGSNNDPDRTLDAPGGGSIAVVRGVARYMNVLHPSYPEVRAYWLEQIENLIDDGADGITLRVDNHATWYTEPDEFGFNPPVVEAFKQKYGVNILTQPFDREKWRELQGDAYTQFVREARELTAKRGVKFQLSINQLMVRKFPYWNMNNVPVSIQWQWNRWIEEKLCDSVELKLTPWPWGSYEGKGADIAKEVCDLAHANGLKVWANARIQTWWLTIWNPEELKTNPLTQADVDKITERLRWVWQSQAIDGLIVYENFDFTYLDGKTGKTYVSPAFKSILQHIRQNSSQQLRAETLNTLCVDDSSATRP